MAQQRFSLSNLCLIILVALTCVSGKRFRTTKLGAKSVFLPTKVNVESTNESQEYQVYNYTQTLDHFNFRPESYTTFQQRYVIFPKHWGGHANNSPIFLYAGDETSIMNDVNYDNGFERVIASRFNGLLIYIEHRYYGTSMPFGSKDEAYKNANTLGYFTSEQALADYAQIIIDVKRNLSAENSPVIVVGASYGGMLASWFRLKYPHIVYGAYASSAPILYFLGLTPENGYASIVSKDINHRYYGTSMPFGSKDEAYKNANTLGYFTSEQALADYAQIIIDVKRNLSAENSPVIVVGASYGGMLASWFRLKYPHIVYGAYASSAPILYFLGLTPENGYASIVSKDINITSTSCYNTIRESWFEIDRVAAQPGGLLSLSQTFNTCLPMNTTTTDLKYYLEIRLDALAQYSTPSDNYLQTFCNATDGAGENAYILDKVVAGFSSIYGTHCKTLFDEGFVKNFGWDWQ
nr:lysosomal Pro-X carboxypeptidase-like [Tanacetum cinerariifolium]